MASRRQRGRPRLSDQRASTIVTVIKRREGLAPDEARELLDRSRVLAQLAHRAGKRDRERDALIDEAAAALARAELIDRAPHAA